MTVKELKEKLNGVDSNLEVAIDNWVYPSYEYHGVTQAKVESFRRHGVNIKVFAMRWGELKP